MTRLLPLFRSLLLSTALAAAAVPALQAQQPERNYSLTDAVSTELGKIQPLLQAKNTAGALIYEVGCNEGLGYWVERTQDAWKTTPCWDLALSNNICRYTTAAEVLASWKGVLAGSPAEACDVQQGRRVGRDAQGMTVYELKCGAGDGYFVRVDAEWKARQFHPCATAQHIAGGCTLTPGAAPAPAEQ